MPYNLLGRECRSKTIALTSNRKYILPYSSVYFEPPTCGSVGKDDCICDRNTIDVSSKNIAHTQRLSCCGGNYNCSNGGDDGTHEKEHIGSV